MKGHARDGGTSETTRSNGESGGVCLEVIHGDGQVPEGIEAWVDLR